MTIVNIYDSMIFDLDDNWENCYGDAEFDQTDNKFPDAKGMIQTIKDVLGFRVTLWIHPFVNLECSSWKNSIIPPIFQPYVKDKKGQKGIGNLPGLVYWWQGKIFPQKNQNTTTNITLLHILNDNTCVLKIKGSWQVSLILPIQKLSNGGKAD